MRSIFPMLFAALACVPSMAAAEEPRPDEAIQKVVKAAGGQEKLLTLFRIKERLNVSSDESKKGFERSSVLEPPAHWWVGKNDRVKNEKEPATFLVWGWTLGAITSEKSKVEAVPDVTEGERALFGLRVGGTIEPPMELYFDKEENRLVRIDWRTDIHRFSEWKEHDGVKYPSRCVGYKKATGKPWYFTEILELERLKELPEGLAR